VSDQADNRLVGVRTFFGLCAIKKYAMKVYRNHRRRNSALKNIAAMKRRSLKKRDLWRLRTARRRFSSIDVSGIFGIILPAIFVHPSERTPRNDL
jgi:hypothetical protein